MVLELDRTSASKLARKKDIALSEQAKIVMENRYLLKNDAGDYIEDAAGVFDRVAKTMANIDAKYGALPVEVEMKEADFYNMMAELKFLPNSPTMMNAGTPGGTLSACFVLPLEDSMEGIMKAAHDAAMVQKFGGGTGFALSKLRAKGTPIKTTHGKACGPVEVLRTLSRISSMITQAGKRDGANMAVMSIYHPDILEFIECKAVEGDIHNFNISVGVDSEFMRKAAARADYNLIHPHNGEVAATINAGEVFDKIVEGAWKNGEPGVIFLDRVNKDNYVKHLYGEIIATNPCGEQPLLGNESCNLGSINLAVLYDEDSNNINMEELERITRLGVQFLDNVIDANVYATEDIERQTKATRKIGLGLMGFADLLYQMQIPYNSEAGRHLGARIMQLIQTWADDESMKLAQIRGYYPDAPEDQPFRNSNRLTVAPTGTISMVCEASSGVEPVFGLVWTKQNIMNGKKLYYTNKYFEKVAREEGFYSEDLMDHLASGGSLRQRTEVPEWVKSVFVTAMDISAEDHVMMQAAFQDYCDSGISKTINFPNHATRNDVRNGYMLAWRSGCKGITVYRSGSRELEILVTGAEKQPETLEVEEAACCDSPIIVEESGCRSCKACGWSACHIA